jgi:hypothetical protein
MNRIIWLTMAGGLVACAPQNFQLASHQVTPVGWSAAATRQELVAQAGAAATECKGRAIAAETDPIGYQYQARAVFADCMLDKGFVTRPPEQ